MNTFECIDFWLEQYDDFAAEFNEISQYTLDFDEVVEGLSVIFGKHFPLYEDEPYGNECFVLTKYGFPMWVVIQLDENDQIELSDTVRCWFSSNDDIYCTISELQSSDYRKKLKRKYDKHVTQRIFVMREHSYGTQMTYLTDKHENPQDAFEYALSYQATISRFPYNYSLISLLNMPKENVDDEISDDSFEYYTFGSKTEGEMTMEMRKVDDIRYIDKSLIIDSRNTNHSEDTKFITIMSVTELNKKGVLNYGIERFESGIKAREEAEHIITKWLFQHGYELDDGDSTSDTKNLCERFEYTNLVEICHKRSIEKLSILIKTFEV